MQNLKALLFLGFLSILCLVNNAQAAVRYPFEGEIDFIQNTAYVTFDAGSDAVVELKLKKRDEQAIDVQVDLEKIHTSLFDISTQINILFQYKTLENRQFPLVHGNIKSQYTLLNQKPFRELSGEFAIFDNQIKLNTITFGNIAVQGEVGIGYPFSQNVSIMLSSISLDQFLNFWVQEKTFESDGLLSGEIKIKGNIESLNLRGNLDSYDGFIKETFFNHIRLNIAGVYPQMQITKSILSKADGLSYMFEGPFDLSKVKVFRKQIEALKISPLVESSGSDSEWTIKRVEEKDASAIELKYFKQDENRQGSFGNEPQTGMLGIERSLKF